MGTKIDLRNDPSRKPPESEPLTKEEGSKLATDVGAKMYVECSSFTQEGLKNVFEQAVRVALMGQNPSGGEVVKKKGFCNLL